MNEKKPKLQTKCHSRYLWVSVKIVFTAGCVAWLLYVVDWNVFFTKMRGLNWYLTLFALCVYLLFCIPCALRWRQAALVGGFKLRFSDALNWYLVGGFFNWFLPTGHGGDVVRAVMASRSYDVSFGTVMATIFIERFFGIFVSILFAIIVSFFLLTEITQLTPILYVMLTLAGSMIFIVGISYIPYLKTFINKMVSLIPIPAVRTFFDDIFSTLDICRGKPKRLSLVVFFSLANQLVMILSAIILSLAIPDFHAPWYSFFLVVPLVFFAALLPSIGGHGVSEAGYVIFLGWFSVTQETAAVFCVIKLLFELAVSILGAFLFVLSNHRAKQIP